MVDLNQPTLKMEEVERRLKMKDDQMRKGCPMVGESFLYYIVCCHKKNFEGLMCPRCSIIYDQKAAKTYEKSDMLELGEFGGKMTK